jgi:hypothetical protein
MAEPLPFNLDLLLTVLGGIAPSLPVGEYSDLISDLAVTTGEILKRERERTGKTIEQICAEIKGEVQAEHLRLLEDYATEQALLDATQAGDDKTTTPLPPPPDEATPDS